MHQKMSLPGFTKSCCYLDVTKDVITWMHQKLLLPECTTSYCYLDATKAFHYLDAPKAVITKTHQKLLLHGCIKSFHYLDAPGQQGFQQRPPEGQKKLGQNVVCSMLTVQFAE